MALEADNLAAAADAELCERLLTLMQELFERRGREIDEQIFEKLRRGRPIEHAEAVQSWAEKHAMHELQVSLQKRIRGGKSRAARAAGRIMPT